MVHPAYCAEAANRERENEDDREGQFPHVRIIVPSMLPEYRRISRSRRWFLRAAALFGGGFTALKSTGAAAADLPNRLGGAVSRVREPIAL